MKSARLSDSKAISLATKRSYSCPACEGTGHVWLECIELSGKFKHMLSYTLKACTFCRSIGSVICQLNETIEDNGG